MTDEITDAQLKENIKSLVEHLLDTKYEYDSRALSGRYNSLLKDRKIISSNDFSIEFNKIVEAYKYLKNKIDQNGIIS